LKLFDLFSLQSGWNGNQTNRVSAEAAGTSIPLTYPVLLVGKNEIRVVDGELGLTTHHHGVETEYLESRIVDSRGGLYAVEQVHPAGEEPSFWKELANVQYRLRLDLQLQGRLSLEATRRLLLESIENPESDWSRRLTALEALRRRVLNVHTLREMMDVCRHTWQCAL